MTSAMGFLSSRKLVRMILPLFATRTRQLSGTGQFGQSNSCAC